jgi:hypothetical protein
MHLFIKVTITLLLIYFGAFSVFKFEGGKSFSSNAESTISFEEKEKSDSESEDLKLAILDNRLFDFTAFANSSLSETALNFSNFKLEVPTSPPNS